MPRRAGANQKTTITFSHEVKVEVEVEGEPIPAGTYALEQTPLGPVRPQRFALLVGIWAQLPKLAREGDEVNMPAVWLGLFRPLRCPGSLLVVSFVASLVLIECNRQSWLMTDLSLRPDWTVLRGWGQ